MLMLCKYTGDISKWSKYCFCELCLCLIFHRRIPLMPFLLLSILRSELPEQFSILQYHKAVDACIYIILHLRYICIKYAFCPRYRIYIAAEDKCPHTRFEVSPRWKSSWQFSPQRCLSSLILSGECACPQRVILVCWRQRYTDFSLLYWSLLPMPSAQATEKRYGRYYTDGSPCFEHPSAKGKGVSTDYLSFF